MFCRRKRFPSAAGLLLAAALAPAVASGEPTVLHFDHVAVDAAFARGSVLVGDSNDRNYMVHASRRDSAGIAEVHTFDTDIIHVLEGSATFVTGGTMADPHETAPGEIRSASISGGELRRLSKGDVIVVPAGTPHWFREVPGVFTYFVVKVRR